MARAPGRLPTLSPKETLILELLIAREDMYGLELVSASRRRLKRGSFHSIVDLQATIHRYIAEHNDDPAPFVWTKTADQITAKLNRLNASVHYARPLGVVAGRAVGDPGLPCDPLDRVVPLMEFGDLAPCRLLTSARCRRADPR